MRALLVSTFVVLAVGCTKPSAPEAPKPPPEPPCTGETALVPGVPGSPGHLIPSERNPNGDSELAALMRTMQKDLKDARAALDEGKTLPRELLPVHKKMRCSWPTRPADRTPVFDGFAIAYLSRLSAFDRHEPDPKAAYDGVLESCRHCHEQSCPGPIAAIDALARSAPKDAPEPVATSCAHGADAGM
jgi:hypothetical protein